MTALPISSIRRDGGTQPRDQINFDVARDYAEAMVDGAQFPSVTVFYDGTDYWLADGFHRVEACGLLPGVTEIEADVRQGSRRDAILYSVGANASHGHRRSNADKRRAILTLLNDPEWSEMSDREIARRCNVSHLLVAKVRPPVTGNISSEPTRVYRDRHGNTSVMKIGGLQQREHPAPSPVEPAPLTGRGSRQLRTFLNERRSGADIEVAAEKADIPIGEAKLHDEAEQAGEYADIDAAPAPPPPPVVDISRVLLARRLLALFTDWPNLGTPDDALAAWRYSPGEPLAPEVVASAAEWIAEFAARFPAIEAERRLVVSTMLERIDANVA